eukprot:579897-Hanusia_phi.AAC.1
MQPTVSRTTVMTWKCISESLSFRVRTRYSGSLTAADPTLSKSIHTSKFHPQKRSTSPSWDHRDAPASPWHCSTAAASPQALQLPRKSRRQAVCRHLRCSRTVWSKACRSALAVARRGGGVSGTSDLKRILWHEAMLEKGLQARGKGDAGAARLNL